MPERRVVKSKVAIGHCIFVANAHCEPVTTVLLDLKSHLAWLVAFLMKGRLEKSKMIVIAFSRFDEIIRNQRDAIVFELCAELEISFGVEDTRIFCCFLQDLTKSLNFCSNFSLLCF